MHNVPGTPTGTVDYLKIPRIHLTCPEDIWCEDSNVDLTRVQPHHHRVRQVGPCRQLGFSSQALFLSI